MSTPPPRLSEALAKRYRIERELGAGGMATVYLAHDVRHDRKVALKVLRPELRAVLGAERFLAEIRITARLQHPHILPLIDSGAEDDFVYYVLPFVSGESLRDWLNREQHLSIEHARTITKQVAGALGYAHRQGVVHRDIKPENILIQDGEAMLADFGIALAVKEAGGTRLTETGISLGTPQYMSPEQATGDPHLDARSDIYSLAAVLYEMLAGEPPVTGPNAQAIIAKLMTERPTRLRVVRDTVPEAIDEAVARGLSKLPADRFATATEFMAALEAPTQASDRSAPAPVRSRVRWVVPIAGLAVVGAVIAALIGTGVLRRPAGEGAVGAAAPTQRQITFSGDVRTAAQSPDGRSIAYVTAEDGGQLLVQDLAGGVPIRLGPVGIIRSLEWSPDGSALLVGGTIGGSVGEFGIYLFSRFGGTPRRLATGRVGPRATWSPDGRRIAAGWGELGTITIIDVATAAETTIDSGLGFVEGTAWSPKGDLLAFVSLSAGLDASSSAIHVLDVTSRARRVVVQDSLRLASPHWSPQSDAIYYTAGGMLRRIGVSERGTAFGSPVPLLVGLRVGNGFSLSADGRQLSHVRSVRRSNLWELAFKMGAQPEPPTTRQLTTGTALDATPSISPDGRWIAFIRCTSSRCDLFRMGTDGATPEQLTFSGRVTGAAWSPDGDRLAFLIGGNLKDVDGWRVGVMDSRGGPVHVVDASSPLPGSVVGWAPGPSIVYQSASPENWASFHAVDSASGNPRPLLRPDAPAMREARAGDTTKTWRLYADNPHLSPSGAHLAFQKLIGLNTYAVWVVSLPGGSLAFRRARTQFVGWQGENGLLAIVDNARLVRISLAGGSVTDLGGMPSGRRCAAASQLIRGRMVCSFEDAVADAWLVEGFDPAMRPGRP